MKYYIDRLNDIFLTYRLDRLFQTKDLLLKKMQRAGLAAMTRECGGTRRMNAIHPIFQLHLTWRLKNTKRTFFFSVSED